MSAYLWPSPKLLGYVPLNEVEAVALKIEEGFYMKVLRELPEDKAAVLEFESLAHLRSGQSLIGDLARRELGFKVRTTKQLVDGKHQLVVWRKRDEYGLPVLASEDAAVPGRILSIYLSVL